MEDNLKIFRQISDKLPSTLQNLTSLIARTSILVAVKDYILMQYGSVPNEIEKIPTGANFPCPLPGATPEDTDGCAG